MEIQKVLHLHKELEKKKPKINGDYIITEKLDGWYVYADYINGSWSNIISSAGREIPSMLWARSKMLERLPKPSFNCRVIAEATIDGLDFHTLNGRFNRTLNGYQEMDLVLNTHDVIPWDRHTMAFYRKDVYVPQICSANLPNVREIPVRTVSNNQKVWMQHAEEVWNNDGEGVILLRVDSVYSAGKRNSDLMKIKLEDPFDLLVVDYYMTIGEKGNESMNMKLKDSRGCFVDVRVGKDKDQVEFGLNSPIGKVATIKCMKQTDDGYREPRFMHLRYDKLPHEID